MNGYRSANPYYFTTLTVTTVILRIATEYTEERQIILVWFVSC